MKNYKEILADIAKNRETIAAQENEIIKLDMKAEKAEAVKTGTMKDYKAIKAEADKNAEKISALCESIYKLKFINKILQSNAEAAFINEAAPIIKEAFKRYAGKQYGEKTRCAIYEAVKAHGIGFYISGNEYREELTIYTLEPYRKPEAKFFTGEMRFVDASNKIQNPDAVRIPARAYIEDPEARAAEIIKAKKALEEATKAAKKAESELNALLPRSIDNCYNLDFYKIDYSL